MKKNKNDLEKVIETVPVDCIVEHERGSVGEFIDLLKTFPSDCKFNLNGNINIDNAKDTSVTIYPQCDEYRNGDCDGDICDICKDRYTCDMINAHESEMVESPIDKVVGKYNYGFAYEDNNILTSMRQAATDEVIDSAAIARPNECQLAYEDQYLLPNQKEMIDEIRHHNVYMAETMAEVCRRSISAMLEYNTQILSHFAASSTVDMCKIVDNDKAKKILDYVEEEGF